ncbi:MAG TPA: sigma-70 family RNA polymerase sigma factor [Polyangiaceae bacterium]|nr:sigma-70 family RNA polymerase sigma factor [Polyangiaceae bacterium]
MTAGLRIHRLVASVFSVGRTAEGADALSLDRIHDDHADFVFRSLQRLGVRDRDLEDALQDVFVVVHQRLHTFDASSRITTWLYGICIRVAAAHRRRAHVRRETPSADGEDVAPVDPSPSPEAVAERQEERERLAAVLDALPPERRAVFVMFEIEGFGASEIAGMLGVPEGTVHSRLSTARKEFLEAAKRAAERERRGGRP